MTHILGTQNDPVHKDYCTALELQALKVKNIKEIIIQLSLLSVLTIGFSCTNIWLNLTTEK